MKRNTLLIIICLLFFLTLVPSLFTSCDFDSASDISSECIRIHIRANSNDERDQQVKLKVRDAITAYLESALSHCKSKDDAIKVINENKQNIVNIANNALYHNDCSYKTSIVLKCEYFAERTYGDYTLPEGKYDALIVYLGEGKGDNWWCVAFPPLCFVPNTSDSDKITYKSWVKELLNRIFS